MFKNNSKYGNLLTGLLIVVIIAIVGVIGYFGYKILTEDSKEKASQAAVDEFDNKYTKKTKNSTDNNNEVVEINGVDTGTQDGEKVYMEGYEVVAKMRIPAINLEYPILNEVTRKSLDTAICLLYTTGGINQVGNTVFIGHNYRNSLFFSKTDQLNNGDKVYVKDTSGEEIEYTIYDIFETTSTDTSFYQRDTDGKREITLSTCTDDASTTEKRLILLARENN